jgi:secondary thiamine-phosphate synthase enzyme
MASSQINIADNVASIDSASRPSNEGQYKVIHKVVDWITSERMQFINISERVNEVVRRSGVRDGLVHLQSLHTTAGLMVCEWQDALVHDSKAFFDEVVQQNAYYRHNDPKYSDCERQNADSHMRGMLLGPSLSLQVRNNSVLLGTWQSIILAEFDGPRSRSLAIQVSGV